MRSTEEIPICNPSLAVDRPWASQLAEDVRGAHVTILRGFLWAMPSWTHGELVRNNQGSTDN